MSSARTHYELLSVEASADPEVIKAAFRQQVARYHPDKVAHLGPEFQDLAARRTAELTEAYRTLTNVTLRRDYDESLARTVAIHASGGATEPVRFAAERAGGDGIVHRALIGRVRQVVVDLYGDVDSHRVRGFDVALVPRTNPPLMRSPFPRVFVRLVDQVGVTHVNEACADAVRARLHVPRSPINVLLFSRQLDGEADILAAIDGVQHQHAREIPQKTYVVIIDAADWRSLLARDAPRALRTFVERLRP